MTEQEKLVERLSEVIYTDWNKSPDFDWNTLPEYRKHSYRQWVNGTLFALLHENGVVRKVESEKDVVLIPFVGLGVQVEITIPIEVSKLSEAGYTQWESLVVE